MKKFILVSFTIFSGMVAFAQNDRMANSNPASMDPDQPFVVGKFMNPQPTVAACDTLNYPINPSWTQVYYTTGVSGSGGFVNGPNQYLDKEKANYFDASTSTFTKLQGMLIAFSHVYSSNNNKIVVIKVYDGTSGSPGTLIGSKNMTIGEIRTYTTQNYFTQVIFSPALNLPASKKFFVSVDISNLSWTASPKDSLAINSNSNPQSNPTTTWEKQSNNTWYRYDDVANSWSLNISLYIFPFITNTPYAIGYTQNPISTQSICAGTSVNFDASSSIIGSGLLWNFGGGLPATSNTVTQSVQYPAPGTFTQKLYILGGGCDVYDSLSSTVTVIPSPIMTVTPTPSQICIGNNSNISAVGASQGYNWAPGGTLNVTTGPNVIATPTATTTYTVTGTNSNGCTSTSPVTVTVLPNPVVSATTTTTNICILQSVTFNATASQNVTTYSWVFPGGTPPNSSAANVTVTYNSPGTFLAHLYASNSCRTDSSFITSVTAGCVGVNDESIANSISTFFNHNSGQLEMNISNSPLNGVYSISIVNAVGQVIYKSNSEVSGNASFKIDMSSFSNGVYFVRLNGDNTNFSRKIMKD
jgi:serine protease